MGRRASLSVNSVSGKHNDMGELDMSEALEGIIRGALKGTPLAGMNLLPKLDQQDLVIELTEQQFKDMVLANTDEKAKQSISIKINEGKITIRVRLL